MAAIIAMPGARVGWSWDVIAESDDADLFIRNRIMPAQDTMVIAPSIAVLNETIERRQQDR